MMNLGHGRAQLQKITDRRHAPRQGHAPAARALPGLGRLRRDRHGAGGAVHPRHGGRRVRHPQHRGALHVGRHQHHADRRLPRRRTSRGHCGRRAGDGPVRQRDRARRGRRPAHATCCPSSTSRTPPRWVRPTTAATTGRSLDKALAQAGYDELRAEQRRRREAGDSKLLGIGVSVYVEITGGVGADERSRQGRDPSRRHRHDLHGHLAPRPGPRHGVVVDRQRPDRHRHRQVHARLGRHRPHAQRRRHDGLAVAAAGRGRRPRGRRRPGRQGQGDRRPPARSRRRRCRARHRDRRRSTSPAHRRSPGRGPTWQPPPNRASSPRRRVFQASMPTYPFGSPRRRGRGRRPRPVT